MELNEVQFAQQFAATGNTLNDIFARQLLPGRDEVEAARAAREEESARAERAERLAMLDAMAGRPLAELSRAQQAAAAARDRVADLERQLADARAVLHRAAEAVVDFGDAADQVLASADRRSGPVDLLSPAKAAHREFAAATRAAFEAAQAGTPQRAARPKGPGGHAVRSEVTCKLCIKYGATPEQSFLIHQDPAPEPAPAVPSEDEREWLDSSGIAERRTPGRYAEIRR